MTVIAFDQATKNTAYSIGINGKLANYGTISAKGDADIRSYKMTNMIIDKIDEVKPDLVVFEDIQLERGNVKVYQVLARLQGMIIYKLNEMGIKYETIAPSKWKSNIDIFKKPKDVKGINTRDWQKAECVKYVSNRYNIDLNDNDDIADSIGILIYAHDKLIKED